MKLARRLARQYIARPTRWRARRLPAIALVAGGLCLGLYVTTPGVAGANAVSSLPTAGTAHASAPWSVTPETRDRHCHIVDPFPHVSIRPLVAPAGGFVLRCVQPPAPGPLDRTSRVAGLVTSIRVGRPGGNTLDLS